MRGLANTEKPKTEAVVSVDPPHSEACSPMTERLRVLITDDNTTNRKLLRVVLEAENHVVLEADNGLSALQVLEQEPVDAVISDILMPEMDGYRLCYEIRKSPKLKTLPFIVYTASYTSTSDETVALQFGVDKFLRKPASSEEIAKSLHEVLASAKIRARDDVQIPEEAEAMREYNQVLVRKLEETIVDLSEANKTLAERNSLAEFVAAVSNAISEANGLREMLRRCCDAMVEHLGCAFARIWTLDEKKSLLELQASSGMYTHIDGGHARVPVGQFKIGLVASERKPHLTNAVIGDPRVHNQEWAKREGMVAFAGYPLLIGDQLVGVMATFARKPFSQNTLDAMGSVARSIAVGIQRQLAEDDLRGSEERFRELAENINEIFFVADPGGGTVHYASPAYEGIAGQKRDVLYQNPHAWLEIIHPDDRARVEEALGDNTESLDQEYRIVRSDGNVRWLRSRAFPVKDESGAVIRVVGIAADITKRKQVEEKLNENLNRTRAILETALDCIITMDREGKIIEFNPAAEKTFKYTRAEAIGKELSELIIPPSLREKHRRGLAHYLTTGDGPVLGKRLEVTAMRADGTEFPVELIVSRTSIDGPPTFTGFIRDISERKQAEEQIQRNLERIKALHEIDLAITSTLDLRQRLDILLDKIDIFLPFPAASTIRLFNAARQKFENTACRNIDEQEWKLGTGRGTGQLSREFLKTKGPVIVPNIQTDIERKNTEFFRKHGFVSYIGVPLIAKGNVVGVLGFYTKEAHEFTRQEIDFLTTLAGQAAVAIDNAQLHEQTERHLRRIEAVNEINNAITSTLSLDNVLNVLLERIEPACPIAVAAGVRLLDKETGKLVPIAARNIPLEEWREQVAKARGLLSRQLTGTRAPIVILNMLTDSRTSLHNFARKYGLVSYLGVPLIVKDEFIGNLVIYAKEQHEFTAEDIEFFTTLARQAAIAIHNARLYEETERRRRAAEELARVAQSLTETLDPTIVGERIVTSVRELFGVRGSALRLRQADGSFRHLASSGEVFSQTSAGDVMPSGVGLTDRAVTEGKPIWSRDILNDPEIVLTDEMRDYQIRSGNRSMIVVPLRAHEKLIGTLTLSDRTGRMYLDNEVALLQTFADQAALALENARLYEETHRSRKELETTNQSLERSLQQLDSLYTALAPIAAARSNQELIGEIIERLIEATGADAALIRTWDKNAATYPVIGQVGYSREFIEETRPERAEGAVGWVIQHGEPVIARDIASDDRLKRKSQLTIGLQSCAILPLRVHSEVRGVIQISSRARGYFDEEQKDHLLALARQMSIALENRELFYSLKASRDELERANRVKDEFLSVMSHELRTPLSVILGYSRMFHERQLGALTKNQHQAVEVVLRNSQELLEMIESIMDATKIEAGSMTPDIEPVSPLQLLLEIKVAYDFPIAKNVRLEWQFPESLPMLWSDYRKLRQVLTNLINNAIKFTEEGCIVISAEEKCQTNGESTQRWMEFRVRDSGVGIPPEECQKIFDRFHQVDSSKTRRFEGVGLGLYIVKSFTEMLRGRVSVSSEIGSGSTFTISLPIEIAP